MAEFSGTVDPLGQLRVRREVSRLAATGKVVKPATVAERKELERRSLDRRSLRAKGRTKQFNVKAKPDWVAAVQRHAEERKISLPEMLERIVSEWEAAKLPGLSNDYPVRL